MISEASDEESFDKMREMFGPTQINQQIRQAEVSHGVVRCWIVPFSRDLASLRQRRGTRPEHPVVAAAEGGFGYRGLAGRPGASV